MSYLSRHAVFPAVDRRYRRRRPDRPEPSWVDSTINEFLSKISYYDHDHESFLKLCTRSSYDNCVKLFSSNGKKIIIVIIENCVRHHPCFLLPMAPLPPFSIPLSLSSIDRPASKSKGD